jgi:hypothetical protein
MVEGMRRIAVASLWLALAAIATGAGAQSAGADGPDLILHDAVILTLDAEDTIASALAVSGEEILAVGDDEEILALAGPDTVVVDLDGKAVTPGSSTRTATDRDRELYGGERRGGDPDGARERLDQPERAVREPGSP